MTIAWLPQFAWATGVSLAAIATALPRRLQRGPNAHVYREELSWYWDRLLPFSTYCPWRRTPRVHLEGRDHIDRALLAGHGVILWVSPTDESSMSVKQALYEAGYAVCHLSHRSHGLGDHPWAHRLAFIRNHAEDRYLAERILMQGEATVGTMRALQQRLAGNCLVTITVADTSRNVLTVRSAGRTARIAGTPVRLAHASGAALLPVFTRGDAGGTAVIVEPPLPTSPLDGPQPETAIRKYLESRHRLQPAGWYAPGARPIRPPRRARVR